ncbi:TIGR04211 family SH3 domain-containing protein [Shewanella surugensis]|uniref:TIGR04211 family SH3 domain-containing protein n=1 Tax=Shewanella surugensis TaxID=212020 RepID=A0ABT0LDP6_9GAMM|nr:TIGR04211 family SH3 domain-containing protein [Shewanella surugensis]MCL1125812.1 TIGR04211 family SH3 domain-containing protein [Shewanella surugensis]
MLRLLTLVGLMLLSPSLLAANQTRYISDDVYLYLLGGPGTQYRILGSIEAGQSVTFLSETQGDYSKVTDQKGREGWVESKLLTKNESLRFKYPKLQKELEQTKAKLSQALGSNDNNVQDLSEVTSQLAKIKAILETTTTQKDKAIAKLDHMQKNERFEMWKQGGIIAGIGLIFGMVLVYLPRPTRKKKNSW